MKTDDWLEKYFGGEFFSGKLSHLKKIINSLNLDLPSEIITIAGTNGKGQTARLIAEGLYQNNKSYGLWTSPHLDSVTERFVFNHQDISQDKLLSIFNQLFLELKTIQEEKLSYFEFLFLCFLKAIEVEKPDCVILEVGLGGRLDAVNVLDAKYFLLTSISRDHQELLGNRLEMILTEKLGLLRDEQVFISSLELEYLRRKTKRRMLESEAEWTDLFEFEIIKSCDDFSTRNTVLARHLLENVLNLQRSNLNTDLNSAFRKELMLQGVKVQLFPSHNVDGLRKLVQFFNQELYNNNQLLVVSFSRRSREDLRSMMKILIQYFDIENIMVCRFNHIKAIDDNLLNELMEEFKLDVYDYKSIYESIKNAGKTEAIVTGSNYFLGELLKSFKSSRK